MKAKQMQGECDPTSLGNLALMHGLVDEEKLREALAYQERHQEARIGEALVQVGAFGEKTLQMVVRKQEQVRKRPSTGDTARIVEFASQRMETSSSRIESTMRGLQGVLARLLKR